jgi:hypothetical protein
MNVHFYIAHEDLITVDTMLLTASVYTAGFLTSDPIYYSENRYGKYTLEVSINSETFIKLEEIGNIKRLELIEN